MTTPESTMLDTAWQNTLSLLGGLALLFVTLLGWLGRYHVRRLDGVITGISDMREKYITREELLATLARQDKITEDKHRQSTDTLARIEAQIGRNADEAKTDRIELRKTVTDVAIQMASMSGKTAGVAEVADAISKALTPRTA